jgi:hypothetical protein
MSRDWTWAGFTIVVVLAVIREGVVERRWRQLCDALRHRESEPTKEAER